MSHMTSDYRHGTPGAPPPGGCWEPQLMNAFKLKMTLMWPEDNKTKNGCISEADQALGSSHSYGAC